MRVFHGSVLGFFLFAVSNSYSIFSLKTVFYADVPTLSSSDQFFHNPTTNHDFHQQAGRS